MSFCYSRYHSCFGVIHMDGVQMLTREEYHWKPKIWESIEIKVDQTTLNRGLRSVGSKGRCSEGSLLRRVIAPKGHCSEGSLLRRVIGNCSEGSLLRRVIAPKGHCSEGSFLRRVISLNRAWGYFSNPNPSEQHALFGVMILRSNDPSEQWPFGAMTLWRNGPSEQWPFVVMTLRSNDPSEQWPFGAMTLRRNDSSEQWPLCSILKMILPSNDMSSSSWWRWCIVLVVASL